MSRQVKPGSKPYRAQLRDRLAALGFPEESISGRVAEHLIAECRIQPRTAWRLASELSLDLAAHNYNAISGDPRAGMRGSRIWEYEQWPDRGVRPTVPTLRVLAQVYGTDWRSLLALCDLEHLPAKDLAEYHAEGPAPEPAPQAEPERQVVRTSAATATSVIARTAASSAGDEDVGSRALADAMQLTTTNVDDVHVDDLWADINYLGGAYTRSSPSSVLQKVSFVQDRVATLLKERQRPKQTRDLYLLNAKCCAMMAWMSGDLGKYGPAEQLNSAAWLYTQYADDYLARRWVRTTQARVAFWAGNAVESAQLAADGLKYRVGRRLPDAPLILAEARGWSTVQAEHQVLDAIERWTSVEASDVETPDEDRFFNITKDRRHYMAGNSLLAVGQTRPALREFRTAREVYDDLALENRWEAMDPMIRIDTGRTHLRLGDLDAAAAEVEPVVSADVSRQPDMVRSMLRVLATELSAPPWRDASTARDLAEALHSKKNALENAQESA
jgi:hypothetical protein